VQSLVAPIKTSRGADLSINAQLGQEVWSESKTTQKECEDKRLFDILTAN